ncbi:unnamed protein product [Adineta steineri]|uniref:Uncharacterized protein n=1 Tax=Adineta steineri TaxID=433720 RepID=A0A819RWU3_9BILA|nr:unnamed protein product [Adineta steineri]CAF4126502.1 unnamed protein product [Adineta steineri]
MMVPEEGFHEISGVPRKQSVPCRIVRPGYIMLFNDFQKQMDDILRGQEGNRRVILNYVYRGVEFVVILLIEKEKFNQEIDVITAEIFTEGRSSTPKTAIQEKDDDNDAFETLMEVINEIESKEIIVSKNDPKFVELLNNLKSSSSSDH